MAQTYKCYQALWVEPAKSVGRLLPACRIAKD